MSEKGKSYIVPLKMRESPNDYMDGFLAGLMAARDAIDKSIAHFETTRELFKASGLDKGGPGNPDN
jgi:hypothetical protein